MKKNTLLLFVCILLSFSFISCSLGNNVKIPKVTFNTQTIKGSNYSFKLPSSWHYSNLDSTEGTYYYPDNENTEELENYIFVNVSKKMNSYKSFTVDKESKKAFKDTILKNYPNATNFKYNTLNVQEGEVWVVTCTNKDDNSKLTFYSAYSKNCSLFMRVVDTKSTTNPSVEEAANYLLHTFKSK